MGFSSQISSYEVVINDSTSTDITHPNENEFGRGLELGFRGPNGYDGVASAFPQSLLIAESEYQAWIEEKEAKKNRTSDLIRQYQLPHKDQSNTNYCWGNAPVHGVEVVRLRQNQKIVLLSPASICAPIVNFTNQGGWGGWALKRLISHGAFPVDRWPANAISKQYMTDENLKIGLDYRVSEWIELKPRNMNQLVSLLLRGIPVALGYNWWGHEVLGVDAVWLDGTIAIRIRNSWKGWGDFGFGILQGSKMPADDAVAPLVVMAA
jgi:hypothetical protein